ncbi:transketolase family protein [Aquirufa echingensis]|jgi:transketolase|uniref:Transketolase C-terminal domain-containing protein n=1 Tax=Aquirufa echingensis TaxID=3096516 RepID=A0ABW6CZF0_9BACT
MRKEFAAKIGQLFESDDKLVFLTGDLGYNALEEIQAKYSDRFINAGVAEQNMVGLASGLAYEGHPSFVYSIAPFAVYRTLEQIRLDVCIHNHAVCIVGNGGGYGYGIMGATHHANEDLACLSPLPNMICWVPAFSEDVEYCLDQIVTRKGPAYLRLGLGVSYPQPIKIGLINQVVKSTKKPRLTIITQGPVVKNAIKALAGIEDVDLFSMLTLPIFDLTPALKNSIESTQNVLVIEEHTERGGLAEHLLMRLTREKLRLNQFEAFNAKGYPSKTYGSQDFHWKESGLDVESIQNYLVNN